MSLVPLCLMGTGIQRQTFLQGSVKPQAEGGPESCLADETSVPAVLEGNTELKVGVYETTGWDFAYG